MSYGHVCLMALAFLLITPRADAQQPADRAALLAYQRTEPARFAVRAQRAVGGITLRDVAYPSPQGGTVTAFMLVPPGSGRFPLVIYGHWGSGSRSSFLPEALRLARAGVVVFMLDAPFARSLDSYKPATGPETRAVYVQTAVDTRYAIDLLEAEPHVDRTRIGYVGLSFGAQVGAMLAGVEPRIKTFVLMGGLPSLARTIETRDAPELVRLREGIQDRAGFKRFLASLAEIDSERFVGGPHVPLLFQFGTFDVAVPESEASELVAGASHPKDVRWYATGHEFNDVESQADRFAWLASHLRFQAPCMRLAAPCAPR